MIHFILIFIFAYVAGSVNFSILLFKVLRKGDPRNKFSGNPGATNVYRQAGLFWAIVVFLLDIGRAVGVAVSALFLLPQEVVPMTGFGLILGNRFPCFHAFKGGKGVANYFGFTAALTPVSAVISGLGWLAVFALFRIPYISSFCMVAILATGTLIDFNSQPVAITGTLITAVFIIISHRKNLLDHGKSKRTD